MKKILLMLSVICLLSLQVGAQNNNSTYNSNTYKTAIGLKFYPGAVSLKHFIQDLKALEFLGYFRSNGFRITGLYEIHGNITNASGLKWYVGPGAHVTFFNEKAGGGGSGGVDGVVGLDFKVKGAPLDLAVDWQPSIEFKGANFIADWFGIAIRFTL